MFNVPTAEQFPITESLQLQSRLAYLSILGLETNVI